MFAYQARPRGCFREDGRELVFPNPVHIDIVFTPLPGFGGVAPPARTAIENPNTRLNFNTNTGRMTVENPEPMAEIEFQGEVHGITVHLRGTTLELDFQCSSRQELEGVLNTFHHVLPAVLGLTFFDSPTIATTSGFVADVPFTWQILRGKGSIDITNAKRQLERVRQAMDRLSVVGQPGNRRLLAALSYFTRAVRLATAGAYAYEFTGEEMLNYAKCLESLFPVSSGIQSRDAVRAGLASLGFSNDDIETWFLPAMVLRDQVDVAHIRLTLFSLDQLVTIQQYSEEVQDKFRQLLQTILERIESGSYEIAPYEDEGPDRDVTQALERMKSRLASVPQSQTPSDPSDSSGA